MTRRGADPPVDDSGVTELGVGEERVVRVDQTLVRAPVDRQRRLRGGGPGRVEVRVDVGAAERVDRLLGIGDQHKGLAGLPERLAHDLPLCGVGVLELVDEGHGEARPQQPAGGLAGRAAQRRAQALDEVVIAHHRQAALALVELAAGRDRQAHSLVVAVPGRRVDLGGELVDRGVGDRRRLAEIERRHAHLAELAQVEVVDDVGGELGEVLDEARLGLEVARDPQAAEDLLAEAVGGHDRRRVKAADRPGQVGAGAGQIASGEQRHDRVGVGRHSRLHRRETPLDLDQPLAHPVAQLPGRDPGEGDQENAVELEPLGDVAGGEGSDRVRLAGPGARLEHRDPLRQRPADVELSRGAHRALTSSRESRGSHSRRASRPSREVSSCAQPSPLSSAAGPAAISSASGGAPPKAR